LGLPILLLLAIAACQPPASSLKATKAAAPQPPPATPARAGNFPPVSRQALRGAVVQVWHPWFGIEASLLESQVAEFNRTNEWGITAFSTGQSGYTELFEQVRAALSTSDRPQLVIGLPEFALEWAASGSVTDLTGYVKDPQYGLTAEDESDFPAAFWSQDVVAGRRLGVPAERTADLLLYDLSWARRLGFETAPRSADEFREQACRAHQTTTADQDPSNDAQGGWRIDPGAAAFESWMLAFGGGLVDGNGYRFLTPKNLKALTFVKQLHEDGCAWTAPPAQDAPTAFAAQEALFATASLEQLPDYTRAMSAAGNADVWTVLSYPGPDQRALVTYGSSYIVLKSTPEQQLAAWLLVRWLLSPQNQMHWAEVTGLFPLRASSLASLADYRKSHPQWSAAIELLPLAQAQPQLASWRQVRVMVGDGFDAMFRSNTPVGRVAEILAIMEKTAGDLSK
jgi:ABC-type glycerol-3-phosphate transport system substrate-binding protein